MREELNSCTKGLFDIVIWEKTLAMTCLINENIFIEAAQGDELETVYYLGNGPHRATG